MRPTIRDVAIKSGFSIATVSMVLNHKNVSIPQTTREKVWQAASSLGYRPNQLAVGLLTKRTMLLGLLIPDNSSLFFASLSKSIETEARKAGYNLVYGNSDNSSERDIEYVQTFTDRQVDGIIVLLSPFETVEAEEQVATLLRNASVPIIAVDRYARNSGMQVIQMNHFKAGYLVAKHLLQLGHTRLACFANPGELSARDLKVEGFKTALTEFGLNPNDSMTILKLPPGEYMDDAMGEAMVRQIQENHVTAVQCISDSMAVALYRAAEKAGMCIPEDLSVVGSDDLFFSDMLTPPLTTIWQPIKHLATATIDALLAMIEKNAEKPVGQETENTNNTVSNFEPRLIIRESTASPKT